MLLVYNRFENAILKFQKKSIKIVAVGNVVLYQLAKFQFQIPYIRGSIKKQNLTDFDVLKMYTVHYYIC
jgi:hypothetical protein